MQRQALEARRVSHAETILRALDDALNARVELTLYGRAALQLGFPDPPKEFALSRDVDAVLWLGQAEELAAHSNFWDAVEQVNRQLADQELYVSHFFEEDQVILLPEWRSNRVRIPGQWRHLALHRLGDRDLFLTKLMRDDPMDHADVQFIVRRAGLNPAQMEEAILRARVPPILEIQEQFRICSRRILAAR